MTNLRMPVSTSALTSFLLLGVMSAATLAADLSKYREFQLGTDLPTVAKLAASSPSRAKTVQSRPALIQELEWRPQPLGASSNTEPAQSVIFSFFNGELFRIVVNYDRYETEGLTTDDMVDAFSAGYGTAAKPAAPARTEPGSFGYEEIVLVQWQDSQYRFDLIRSSFGPSFKLVGVLKRLEAPVQVAILEAARLDDKEAPQKEAARIVSEDEAAKAKLDKARLVNKPKFKP